MAKNPTDAYKYSIADRLCVSFSDTSAGHISLGIERATNILGSIESLKVKEKLSRYEYSGQKWHTRDRYV